MYMVMFVLHDPDRLDGVLDAWRAAGVSGVTILETIGAHSRKQRRRSVGARYAFGMGQGATQLEVGNYTLIAIVPDEATVGACIEAAESVVGNLDDADTGVLAAWQLDITKGIAPGTAHAARDEA